MLWNVITYSTSGDQNSSEHIGKKNIASGGSIGASKAEEETYSGRHSCSNSEVSSLHRHAQRSKVSVSSYPLASADSFLFFVTESFNFNTAAEDIDLLHGSGIFNNIEALWAGGWKAAKETTTEQY